MLHLAPVAVSTAKLVIVTEWNRRGGGVFPLKTAY